MSKQQFVKNTLDAMNDKGFPTEYLESLYDNIGRRALRIPPNPGHSPVQRRDSIGATNSIPDIAK